MSHLQCTAQKFAACRLLDGGPCAICQQYISLEAQILTAQTKQRDLRAQFNDIHDPITSRLPSEIVSEIFKFTLTREIGTGFDVYRIDSPLFLGAVCRSWRNIAWSSPSLWNWIHIYLMFPVPKSIAELVEEWFARSGELPLMIYISCDDGVDEEKVDEFLGCESSKIVDSVNLHSERWKNVHFACPRSLVSLFSGNSLGAPNLERLTLDPPYSHSDSFNFYMKGPTQPSYITLGYAFKQVDVAWNNVTNLYASALRSSDCIRLIQQTPQLMHCQFLGVIDYEEDVPFPRDVFVHEFLQTLEFMSRHGHKEQFFDHFSFPCLTDLVIRFASMDSSPVSLLVWENSIRPFMTRSCQQLSSLVLQYPCQSGFLLQTLGTIPTLSTLRLYSCLGSDNNWHALFGLLARTCISRTPDGVKNGSSEEEFLPNLRTFYCWQPMARRLWSTFPWSSILDIFGPLSEIGNPHRRPLDNLTIEANFESSEIYPAPINIDSESLQRFLGLIDAGIGLRLIDSYSGRDVEDLIKLSMAHHGIDHR